MSNNKKNLLRVLLSECGFLELYDTKNLRQCFYVNSSLKNEIFGVEIIKLYKLNLIILPCACIINPMDFNMRSNYFNIVKYHEIYEMIETKLLPIIKNGGNVEKEMHIIGKGKKVNKIPKIF